MVAVERLVIDVQTKIAKAIEEFGYLDAVLSKVTARVREFGTSLQRMPVGQIRSMTDAIEATYGKTVMGAAQMGGAIERTIAKMEKMPRAMEWDLKALGVDQLVPKIERVGGAQKLVNKVIAEQNKILKQAPALLTKIEAGMNKVATVAKKAGKSFQITFRAIERMLLSVGLSFLFTGMAIQRFLGNTLRSLFQTFLMVEGEGGIVNDKVNELKASLEFMKWSLIDAFVSTGLIDNWIERIDRLVEWFNTLDEDTKAYLVDAMVLGSIVAAVMMVFGQTLLFILGVLALLKFFGGAAFLPLIVGILVVIALLAVWNSDMSTTEKWLWTLVVAILAVSAMLLLMWGAAALPFVIIGLIIAAALLWFARLIGKVGSVENSFTAMGISILEDLAPIYDFVRNKLYGALERLINLINAARGMLGMEEIKMPVELEEFDDTYFTDYVAGLRAKLTDKIVEEGLAKAEMEKTVWKPGYWEEMSDREKILMGIEEGVEKKIWIPGEWVKPEEPGIFGTMLGGLDEKTQGLISALTGKEWELPEVKEIEPPEPTVVAAEVKEVEIPTPPTLMELYPPELKSVMEPLEKTVAPPEPTEITEKRKEADVLQAKIDKLNEQISGGGQPITNIFNIDGVISKDNLQSFMDDMSEQMCQGSTTNITPS